MSEALKEEYEQEQNEQQENNEEEITPIVVPTYAENEKKKKKKSLFKRRKKKTSLKEGEKVELEKKKEKVLRQTPSLLPFLRPEEDCIYLKDGVMDMFQMETKDLYSLNSDDINNLIHFQARFLRSYSEPYKEIALNFPANTDKQVEYWTKKRDKTIDPFRLRFIDRKIYELDYIASNRSNREFFIFIYAKDKQELGEKKKQILRAMNTSFPLNELSIEKKQDVLFLLNNQNTKL